MIKEIEKKTDLKFKEAFTGLSGVDIMANVYPIEPVLVFTEFHMHKPVFGPHPHAGVSVMTYMLPDSEQGFVNRDSLGDLSYIEPGGLHVSQTGKGMFHDEFPKITGIDTHGFQIWINHKEKDRWVEPKSFHAQANEIQEVISDTYKLRIILGSFKEVNSNIQLVTDVNLYHLYLNPNSSIELNAQIMAFVYGLKGSATINSIDVKAQTLINFKKEGEQVDIFASSEGFECMYCTANPIDEQIVYGGPFVMTNNEQMNITKKRYVNGELGELKPYTE